MNRFEQPNTNKFGDFNPQKSDYTSIEQDMLSAKPIWVILNMTKEEYDAKYLIPMPSPATLIDASNQEIVVDVSGNEFVSENEDK